RAHPHVGGREETGAAGDGARDQPERRGADDRPDGEQGHGEDEPGPRDAPRKLGDAVPLRPEREEEPDGSRDERERAEPPEQPVEAADQAWLRDARTEPACSSTLCRLSWRTRLSIDDTIPATAAAYSSAGSQGGATNASTRKAYCTTHASRADWRCRFANRRNLTSPTTSDAYVIANQVAASSLWSSSVLGSSRRSQA